MRPVKGEGPRPALSFWVGAGPGEDEVRSGRVWTGPAGRLLNSLLWKEGIDRRDIFITNLRKTPMVKGDGGPLLEVEDTEFEFMRAEPSVVVTMGAEAAHWMLGGVSLEAVHGIPWRVPARRWADMAMPGVAPVVVPIYNPAYAMHDAEAYTLVAYDIGQVKRVLDGHVAPREMRDVYPKPRYSLGFVPYLHPVVYVDTEGWSHNPWCLSYSCTPGVAHVVLARDAEGLRKFQDWVTRRKSVVLHSAMYDLAVLRAMGVAIRDDQLEDTKVLSYVTAVEPQGLKPLGYRHACMEMQSYTDVTKDYDFVQAFEYLEGVAAWDWGKSEPILERSAGKVHVRQPQPLNTRVKAIFSAIAKGELDEDAKEVNPRTRWLKIDPEIRAAAEAEIGPMPEFTLDLLPIDDAVYYACRDADATCRIHKPLREIVKDGGHEGVYRTDIGALPMVERMQANGLRVQPGYFEKLEGFFTIEMDKVRKKIESFNQGVFINPGSSDQTAALLFGRLRLPVIKTTKGRKPSTQDKVLEALRGRHEAVGLVCDWRELATLRDKFAKQLPKYVQDDGRVRGNIRDTTVVSGRYSMTEPNLMAIPTRTAIGRKIRKGFVPDPGHVMCGADFDQVELRVIADLGRDEGMIKAFIDGRDIHSETASLIFGVPLKDVDPLLHRYPAKRIGFGVATGITELGLYDQMRLAGLTKYTVGDCAAMIRDYFKARPGVKRMIEEARKEALRDGYVRDRGGRIRYLPGVYSGHPAVKEEALRQSHSHKVSGTAQWLKKRALARMWHEVRNLPRWEVEPLLEIHDEVIFEVAEGRTEWTEAMLLRAMSADSGLFAVPITAKVHFGATWGDLKD